MRVTAKIIKNLLRSAKWRLGINHPLGLPCRCQVAGERSRRLE
jgi:hypothetical protein